MVRLLGLVIRSDLAAISGSESNFFKGFLLIDK